MPLLLVAASPAAAEDALDLLWPSPLLNFYDLLAQRQNAALKKLIMRVARNSSGVSKTNIGGWQSDAHFLERTEASVAILRTRAYHAVFRYLQAMAPRGAEGKYEVSIGSAWANVNNRSHSNSPHMHPGVQLSGVYYVDDGGDRDGGLRLIDPRPQASMVPVPARWTRGMGEHVRVAALPGLFVLFPAWLQHYTAAHTAGRPRLSVAFNVRLTFPDDGEEDGFVAGGAASGAPPTEAARLTFKVPVHHQRAFLDSSVAQDMVVQ
uniref:Uncharacterized protein n=1 Tax=Phaeocystis antarctica TaxID=33657 RepID=A0A7S0EMV2_9EUKA